MQLILYLTAQETPLTPKKDSHLRTHMNINQTSCLISALFPNETASLSHTVEVIGGKHSEYFTITVGGQRFSGQDWGQAALAAELVLSPFQDLGSLSGLDVVIAEDARR